MARRGRPPHPDVLTPREWEVLALLRERRSNEEIAERLGISLAGAKYHVSEILGKLGVESREEAARWQPAERPWWAAAVAPLGLLWRKASSGLLAAAVAASVTVLVAAGIGLLVWGLARTSGGRESVVGPTATASLVAGAPTATALEPTPGVAIGETRVLATGNAGGMDWSPDEQSLAYAIDNKLYRADAPNFAPRVLVQPNENLRFVTAPRWSLDGTQIAFAGPLPGPPGNPNATTPDVWLINSDGSGLRDLLKGAAAGPAGPELDQWLDDHTLVFYEHCGTACRQPYLLDTLTSKVTRGVRVPGITTGEVGVGILGTTYYWSPDKRWIAAAYAEHANPIALYDRENQNLVQLPGPPAGLSQRQFQGLWQWFDSWAPDSTRFLYEQLNPNSTAASPLPPSLHVYDIATGEDRTLVEAGSSGSWSRDGRFIAYTAPAAPDRPCGSSNAETACVAVVEVASGHEVYRVPGPGAFFGGASLAHTFLLDGRLIYRGYNARELRVASNGQSEVLANLNGMREFKVSPDDRYVVTSEPGVSGRIILVAIPPP